MRSGFDYLTFCCFQIFTSLLLTGYAHISLMQKHICWAVKRIYWSHVLGTESFMFGGPSVAFGGRGA